MVRDELCPQFVAAVSKRCLVVKATVSIGELQYLEVARVGDGRLANGNEPSSLFARTSDPGALGEILLFRCPTVVGRPAARHHGG
jgi:hypothetical protein